MIRDKELLERVQRSTQQQRIHWTPRGSGFVVQFPKSALQYEPTQEMLHVINLQGERVLSLEAPLRFDKLVRENVEADHTYAETIADIFMNLNEPEGPGMDV